MNPVVSAYRDYLKRSGKSDARSDAAITLDLGNRLRADKRDDEAPPEFWQQYEEIRGYSDPSTLGGIANNAANAWDSSIQALNTVGGIDDQDAEDIAAREQQKRGRGTNLTWENWQRAEGFDAFKTFLTDPIEITSNIVASGLAGSVPGLVGGVVGGAAGGAAAGTAVLPVVGTGVGGAIGAAVGTFPGSLAVEYGNKYLEVLREAGVDLADPESIRTVLQDEGVKAKAMELGLRRGLPVAAFDSISAALGGKFFGGAAKTAAKQGARQLIKEGAEEALVQGALGGGGEIAGSLVAGEEINPKAVFEEVVGELGPGAAEVTSGVARDRYFGQKPNTAAPVATTPAPAAVTPSPVPAPAPVSPDTVAAANAQRRVQLLEPEQQAALFEELSQKPTLDKAEETALRYLKAKFTATTPVAKADAQQAAPVAVVPVAPAPVPEPAVAPVAAPVAPAPTPVVAPAAPPQPVPVAPAPTISQRSSAIAKAVRALPADLAKPVSDAIAAASKSAPTTEQLDAIEGLIGQVQAQAKEQEAKFAAEREEAKVLKQLGTKGAADRLAILRAATAPTPEEQAERGVIEDRLAKFQTELIGLGAKPRTAAEEARYRALKTALKRYQSPAAVAPAAPTSGGASPESQGDVQSKLSVDGTQPSAATPLPASAGEPTAQPAAPAATATLSSAEKQTLADRAKAGMRTTGIGGQGAKIRSVVTVPPEAESARGGKELIAKLRELGMKFVSDSSGSSKTSTAVILEAPDGRRLMRGIMPYTKGAGLKRIDGTTALDPLAVQAMASGGTGKSKKQINEIGTRPASLDDVVAAGYKIREIVGFEGDPGLIVEDFAGQAEYEAARGKTDATPGAYEAAPVANEGAGKKVNVARGHSTMGPEVVSGDEALAAAEGQGVNTESAPASSAEDARLAALEAAEAAKPAVVKKAKAAVTSAISQEVASVIGAERLSALQTQAKGMSLVEVAKLIEKERNTNAKLNELILGSGVHQLAAEKLVRDVAGRAAPVAVEPARGSGDRGRGRRAAGGDRPGSRRLVQGAAQQTDAGTESAVGGTPAQDSGRGAAGTAAAPAGKSLKEVFPVTQDRARRLFGYLDGRNLIGKDGNADRATFSRLPESFRDSLTGAMVAHGDPIGFLTQLQAAVDAANGDAKKFMAVFAQENGKATLPDGLRVYVQTLNGVQGVLVNADSDLPGIENGSYTAEQLMKAGFDAAGIYELPEGEYAVRNGRIVPEAKPQNFRIVDGPPDRSAAVMMDGQRMIDSLRKLGADVQVVQRETLEMLTGLKGALGAHVTDSTGMHMILLAIEDAASPTLGNLITLFHEAGHALLATMPEKRAQLERAITGAVGFDLRRRLAESKAANRFASAEEMLVESLAQRLGAEGVDQSLAGAIVRTLKALYIQAAQALYRMFGKEMSDGLALAYFENQLRRTVGGDFDHALTNFWRPLLRPTVEQAATRHFPVESIPVHYWDKAAGTLRNPEMLPDSVPAAIWNLQLEEGETWAPAMARVQVAVSAEVQGVFAKLVQQFKPENPQAFWNKFARGDTPAKIAEAILSAHPEAKGAAIGDVAMTDAMNQRARFYLYRLFRTLSARARATGLRAEEVNEKRAGQIEEKITSFQKLEGAYKDASEHERVMQEKLREAIKELALATASGLNTAFAGGKLAGEIRALEGLAPETPIPENYQRVFRAVMDGGVRVFDYFQEIAKLNLPLPNMTVAEILAAVREAAVANPTLDQLAQQRELSLAVATLARESTKEMDLLQLRVMADRVEAMATHAELEEIRRASPERLKELAATVNQTAGAMSLRDRLRKEYILTRTAIANQQAALLRNEEKARVCDAAAREFAAAATALEKEVGAFSAWEAVEGAEYLAMQRDNDGHWFAVKRKLGVAKEGGQWANAAEVAHDMVMNRLWLEANRDNPGRTYNEVKRQTEEISMIEAERKLRAANRFFLDKAFMPLPTKFASAGTVGGQQLKKRLVRYDLIARVKWADQVEAEAAQWSAALRKAAAVCGLEHKPFITTVYDQICARIENEPGVKDDVRVFRIAEQVAKKVLGREVPGLREALAPLLLSTKRMSELFVRIAEAEGVHVEDSRVKDTLADGEFLKRHAIKYGWFTVPRMVRAEIVETVVGTMQRADWQPKDTFGYIIDLLTTKEDPMTFAELGEAVAGFFTPEIVREFVAPFARKSGAPIFQGIADKDGKRGNLDQADVNDVWEASNDDVPTFIEGLYRLAQGKTQDAESLESFAANVLKTFDRLYHTELSIVNEIEAQKDPENPRSNVKRHRIMDARKSDLLPPEHLTYDVFDQQSARIALGELAYHAAFGRDGAGVKGDFNSAEAELAARDRAFKRISDRVPRSQRKAAAKAEGYDWSDLKAAHAALQHLKTWKGQFEAHFESGNQGGPMGEAKTFLEFMQANMMLVLNQFKSGLWNVMSIGDIALRYGLGRKGMAATAKALGNLAYQGAGSALEAVGLNVIQASEYSQWLGEVSEHRTRERLPLSVQLADVGKGGEFNENLLAGYVTQVSRGLQTVLAKGFKAKEGGTFTAFNALHSPFQFISKLTAHSIALANVQTFETMLRKAAKFMEEHPDAYRDPSFRFTAEDLGMAGKFFADEKAFLFFRDRLAEYRLGDLEGLARGALGKLRDGNAQLLTKDQVIGLGLMAANEISLESSVSTRFIEYFNNPIIRLGGLMLGWPIAKMNQIHELMRNPETGRYEPLSVLKGLGVLAAWSLPVGIAYSFLMDEYDDEVLRKKSNLRAIDPIAAIPGIGAAAFFGEGGKANFFAALERGARAGSYGLGADFISSMVNIVDPTSGQRDFSLDSRVLVFSQYENVRDMVRNFIHSDYTATYQSTGRGLLQSLGGNGLLQYGQIFNGLMARVGMPLSNDEARVTARINVGNWLRAAGKDAGIELRSGAAVRSSPTPVSVWVREMQLAAYGNDRLGFLEAYRNAIEAARKMGEADPQKTVLASWRGRSPLNVFAAKPTDTQMFKLYQAMDEDGRAAVQGALSAYESFSRMIAPPKRTSGFGLDSLSARRMGLAGL